jgi:hypothetical protein
MPKPETYVSTDVETDGPIPGPNSMLSFASVLHPSCMHVNPRVVPRGLEGTAQAVYGILGVGGANVPLYRMTAICLSASP